MRCPDCQGTGALEDTNSILTTCPRCGGLGLVGQRFSHNTQAARLRASLDSVGWSQRALAAILGEDERKVRRWLQGAYEPPGAVVAWMERLAQAHDDNPAPREHETGEPHDQPPDQRTSRRIRS